jgi:hypothetical protein
MQATILPPLTAAPIILVRPGDEITRLMNLTERSLAPLALPRPLRSLRSAAITARALLPDMPLDSLVPLVIQGVWVAATKALVETATAEDIATQAVAARLGAWRSSYDPRGDHGHQLAIALRVAVRTHGSAQDRRSWWTAANRFLDAQTDQHRDSDGPARYLHYLVVRPVALGLPLTAVLAATIRGCVGQLQGQRATTQLWWLGCYASLASCARDLSDGLVPSLGVRTTEGELQRDRDAAWDHLQAALGPAEFWTDTDRLIGRMAQRTRQLSMER